MLLRQNINKEIDIVIHDHGNATGTSCCPICCAAFLREYPNPENGVGDICRAHDYTVRLAIENAKRDNFQKAVEEMAKCKRDCHTAGHYECWRDNCNCICHAARRVLGIALPESYIPVPKE